jgi:hypothetical protein
MLEPVVGLDGDESITFLYLPAMDGERSPLSVERVAGMLLDPHLEGTPRAEHVSERWERLHERRGTLDDTAGDLLFRMRRGGFVREDGRRQRAALEAAEAIEDPARRFWVTLYLHREGLRREPSSLQAVTLEERQLVQQAQRWLTREARLAALGGEANPDPDLPAGYGAGFLLRHARGLLLPEDAELLADAESIETPDEPVGVWMVAGARVALRPDQAETVLRETLSVPAERIEVLQKLLSAMGIQRAAQEAGVAARLDRIWIEALLSPEQLRPIQAFALQMLQTTDPVGLLRLITGLVRDGRAERLSDASLGVVVVSVEGRLGGPLVGDERLSVSHPIKVDAALRASYLAALQETVGQWAPAELRLQR